MSMCMYLRRISDADAARYRRDPDSVMQATLGAEFNRRSLPFDEESLFEVLDGSDGAPGRPAGIFGRLRAWFVRRAVRASIRKQFEQLKKAHTALTAPSGQRGAADIPAPDAMVDLHKSWQVLHYVLTGTPDSGPAPLNLLLLGGEEVGEDLGYGAARIVDSQAMRDFAKALAAFDLEHVLSRLDVRRMAAAGVYCADEDDDDGLSSDLEEDIRQCFPALKAFSEKAAAARQGALIWIS